MTKKKRKEKNHGVTRGVFYFLALAFGVSSNGWSSDASSVSAEVSSVDVGAAGAVVNLLVLLEARVKIESLI